MAGPDDTASIASEVEEQRVSIPIGGGTIEPGRIGTPFQLLAAALVFIVLLNGALLSAAVAISDPSWIRGVLAVASILNAPLLLGGLFVLQTRFRQQLLSDERYVQVLEMASELRVSIDASGVDTGPLILHQGKLAADLKRRIGSKARQLETVTQQAILDQQKPETIAAALLELGRAAMAEGRWLTAAQHFNMYLQIRADWHVEFQLATAYANAREGKETDQAALDALDRAIASNPATEATLTARMQAYRAGFLKRLGRLAEAEEQLDFAAGLATRGSFEADDVTYNYACVYALTDRPDDALRSLREINDRRFLLAAAGHQHDYFASVRDDRRFRALIDSALSEIGSPPGEAPSASGTGPTRHRAHDYHRDDA